MINELENIKGVGPKTTEKLNLQGIQTINDLLFYFPMKYETYTLDSSSDIGLDKVLTLSVKVSQKPKIYFIRKNLDKLSVQVEIDNIYFYVHIFNRRFLSKVLQIGTDIVITGKFLKNVSSFTATNLVLKKNFKTGIKPIYNFKDIKETTANRIYKEILKKEYNLYEPLPDYILKKRQILNINDLISKIHHPQSQADIANACKRIVYEELLDFAIRIESLKQLNSHVITIKKAYNINVVKDFISTLPFELTKEQKLATNEIFKDLKSNKQMNRLLQGDVGSGKTIISIISSLAVVTAGFQVAIMAPTLVLARQHFEVFKKYLQKFNVNIELLISDLSTKEKKNIKSKIKNNQIDIIIGTHALLQNDIDFENLGFIVIDEQHRFGVKQRRLLREKGVTPDILLMSATPIPRTLAISIYKDIDISFIKEKPIGRLKIITDISNFESLDLLLDKVYLELDKNHQAYVICPMINESETSIKLSVEAVYNLLLDKIKHRYKIDYLHGKMNDTQKSEVLESFYNNETKILVSTTVVEVGINVTNATVMLIMNANTFGLAQLHQLRGRIGRSIHQSYCYLVIDETLEANERLNILKETSDGFLISEYDLKLRGPGEVFGKTQSGIPDFKMANLIKDKEILKMAFKDSEEIIKDSNLKSRKLRNKAIKAIESYNLD